MPLTTNLKIYGHKIDNDKIIKGYLPKPSIIVIEKISVIDASMIIKEIATIEKNEFLKIILSFTAYINE